MFDSSTLGLIKIKFSLMENAHSEGAMNIANGQMTLLAYTWQFLSIILNIHTPKLPFIFCCYSISDSQVLSILTYSPCHLNVTNY